MPKLRRIMNLKRNSAGDSTWEKLQQAIRRRCIVFPSIAGADVRRLALWRNRCTAGENHSSPTTKSASALGACWMGVAYMRVRNPGCAVVLAGMLAGCAVGPDYQTPDAALPVAFLTQPPIKEPASGGADPDLWQWWRTLHDPQLNGLIERALRNNLDLKIALDRLQQARLQLSVIGSQALPEVNGSAGGGVGTGTDETKGRASQILRSADNGTGLTSINQIGGLDAEWEIDLFGKIARRVEAQTYTAEALKEARDWVYVVIAADVSRL